MGCRMCVFAAAEKGSAAALFAAKRDSSLTDSACIAEGGHLRKAANAAKAANARAVFVAMMWVGHISS